MRLLINKSSFLLLFLLLSGCAVHAPMSELVMMPQRGGTKSGLGFSMGGALPVSRVMRTFTTEEGATLRETPLVPHQLHLALSNTGYESSRSALSISYGLMTVGVDYTHKLTNRNYLTAGFSAPAMYQGFLHQKILQSRNNALILSAGVRRERFSYDSRDSFDLAITHAPSVGLRLHGMFRSTDAPREGTRVQLYVGYMPKFDQPVLDVSFSFGSYWRSR